MEKIYVDIIVLRIKTYSINAVAKYVKTKIRYLPKRKGERYASALTNKKIFQIKYISILVKYSLKTIFKIFY